MAPFANLARVALPTVPAASTLVTAFAIELPDSAEKVGATVRGDVSRTCSPSVGPP